MPTKAFFMDIICVLLQYGFVVLLFVFLHNAVKLVRADLFGACKPEQAHSLPRLTVMQNSGARLDRDMYTLGEAFSIGRGPENDLEVQDAFVSHCHAHISEKRQQYIIEDLDSSNHTYVNGEPIAKATILHDGDVLKIGLVTFKFER